MNHVNLSKRFKNQAFRNQIRLSFLLMTGFIFVIAFILTLVWRLAYIQQLNINAYNDIQSIANNMTSHFKTIETVSYRVIDNDIIQTLLTEENTKSDRNSQSDVLLKNQLNNELSNITRNVNSIRTTFIIDNNDDIINRFIQSKKVIIPGYSLDSILSEMPDRPSTGQWFFSENASQGLYARNIYSTDLTFTHLGTLFIIFDTSFLKLENQQLTESYNDNLFFIEYKNKTLQLYDDYSLSDIITITKLKETNNNQVLSIVKYNSKPYYLATEFYGDFSYFYLLPENQVLKNLYKYQWIILLVMIPLLAFIIFIINKISNQLTRPLTKLTQQMSEIQETKQLDSLKELPIPKDRQDEIAFLYKSYNSMIIEINQLINDNYEMRILSQEIEFKSLQAQLDPHFLYNTLDSINWLALANNQPKISEMVTSLAYLFRKKIDTKTEFTSLQDEIDIVNAYINIQKVRFEKRIEYIEIVLIDNLFIQIPKLIIQPLIENVFKHAVNNMKTTCQIILTIEFNNYNVIISVTDNGPGFRPDFSIDKDGGIGLKNIQKRLKLHYGEQSKLFIYQSTNHNKNVVMFNIPLDETDN